MTRAIWLLVAAVLIVAFGATLWFVVRTLPVRVPYWGEAEVVFEAWRLHAHQPLFVDPLLGTPDDPPSRYFVTYPPVFTAVMAVLPPAWTIVAGRIVSTLAWFGTLGAIAWRSRRIEGVAAALFVAGSWVLANFATIGRPDSVAIAVAALALWRADKRASDLDVPTIALFVLVPWIKPTVLGLPLGAVLASRARRAWAIAGGLAIASFLVAMLATRGRIWEHIVASNAQPFTWAAWLEQVPSRLPFFAPLFAWAWWSTRRARVLRGALCGSIGWTLIALAKTGSSSNYWMEPCIAAVIGIARGEPRLDYADVRVAGAALVAVLWADIASVRAAIEHAATYRADAAIVAGLDCPSAIADEAGIELAVDRRIIAPAYQMTYLVHAKKFPAEVLAADYRRVACYVEHTHQLELVPELVAARADAFPTREMRGSYRIWRR